MQFTVLHEGGAAEPAAVRAGEEGFTDVVPVPGTPTHLNDAVADADTDRRESHIHAEADVDVDLDTSGLMRGVSNV